MADMLADAFGPILREGGQEVEVSLRLAGTLAAMHANLPGERALIAAWAERHAAQLAETMAAAHDRAVFVQAYDRLWRPDAEQG